MHQYRFPGCSYPLSASDPLTCDFPPSPVPPPGFLLPRCNGWSCWWGDVLGTSVLQKPAALQNLPTASKEAPKALVFFPVPLHLPPTSLQPGSLKSQTATGFTKQSFQRRNPESKHRNSGKKYILVFAGIARWLSGRIPHSPTLPASAGSAGGRQGAWCYIFILKEDSFSHKCFEEGV